MPDAAQTTETPSDRELVDRARRGDQAAYAALFDRHFDRIFAYCRARAGDSGLAEELAVSTFTRAFQHLDRFRWDGHDWIAWLFRIAHRLSIDAHRARQARPQMVPLPDELPAATDAAAQAAQHLEHEDLRGLVARLPEPQQTVIRLRFFHDLSVAQVARVLGRPVGAVEGLQHRALVALRQQVRTQEAGA
jgi:RNA polymerase sigma-70 factor (ECF subfamily)